MTARAAAWRRWAAEAAFLVVIGLFMGALGPYGTSTIPAPRRYVYWLACIVGGGAIGIGLDETLGVRAGGFWRRVLFSSVAMTPAVSLLVVFINQVMVGQPARVAAYAESLWQVWVISALVMALRALTWRPARTRVETRIIIAPPLPEAEAAFRRRLSARRRTARLIAIEAEDHYLRVHTDAGDELITARFAEALDELAGAHGYRTHRSWWVAANAIESVHWRRGAGEARLVGGLTAPVSRTHAPILREAGWI